MLGRELGATASILLANSSAYWRAAALSQGLSEAMKSRAVIEQAKGMVMAAAGTDVDTAFEILRSVSQQEQRKLRLLAEDIVARRWTPPTTTAS